MGNALVMFTVPEENLWGICDRDSKGKVFSLPRHYGSQWIGARRQALLRQHPNAFFQFEVSIGDVWELPRESDSPDLDAHGAAVRRSLQAFINERLRRLSRMVRTGRWLLERARVRVVACEPVR